MMIDGLAAAQWLLNQTDITPSRCLYWVWLAYKAQGASTGLSAGTAYEAWQLSRGQRPGDRNPPAGAAVWWGRRYDGNLDGDVTISLGGGRVAATDYPGWRETGSCTLDEREEQIGREYLGWTSSIFDCPINVAAGKDAAPQIPTPNLGGNMFLVYDAEAQRPSESRQLVLITVDGGQQRARYLENPVERAVFTAMQPPLPVVACDAKTFSDYLALLGYKYGAPIPLLQVEVAPKA